MITANVSPIKSVGNPRVAIYPCKVHVIVTGITHTSEIPIILTLDTHVDIA